jgi:hypothetical protein
MLLVGRRLKVAARRRVVPPRHGACACRPRGDGAVFGGIEMLAGASRRVRAGAMSSRSCSSSCGGGDAAPDHRRGYVMSSNDGTRPTDAYESLLAHHFSPVSLNWSASRGGTFLGGMLSVNQANDHGEITGSGVADSVAYDSKDRIEVRLERRYPHRRRAVEFLTRAARRLPAAQWRITWFLGANDARKSDRRVSQSRAARAGVYR